MRIRISGPASADLADVLTTSAARWGEAGRERYAGLLASALRTIARSPQGPNTRDRHELGSGVRSFHIRHTRGTRGVKAPVHVVYYRVGTAIIEIIRVLHDRMEPTLHIADRKRR